MSSKTRLPNKTIWSLEDILKITQAARHTWVQARDRARSRLDGVMLAHLAELNNYLVDIERIALQARRGEYTPWQPPGQANEQQR
jgi:hypothetical protein